MFYFRLILVIALLATNAGLVYAAPATHLVISEIQTGSSASASEEFIEIYNPTTSPVDLSGWKIEYKSASGSSWSSKATLSGNLEPSGYYLVASNSYLSGLADQSMSDGLSATGGHVRIKDASGVQVDLIGWGSATSPEGSAHTSPPAGQSLERTPLGEDSDNNSSDFVVRLVPQPQSDPVEETEAIGTTTTEEEASTDAELAEIEITELFVDPTTPLTDSADEFIELRNFGGTSVNLAGLVLQTGRDFHDHYTLPITVVPAGGYVVIYSRQSHLSLTNSGGAARLVDSSGNVVDETAAYEQAEPGQAWAWFEDGWQWSEEPTPAASNILAVTPPEEKAAAATKSKSKKAAKVAKSKNTVKASPVSAAGSDKAQPGATTPTNLTASRWLLIGAAAFTIGYALYEFRHDLYNRFYVIRRYLKARRQNRPAA